MLPVTQSLQGNVRAQENLPGQCWTMELSVNIITRKAQGGLFCEQTQKHTPSPTLPGRVSPTPICPKYLTDIRRQARFGLQKTRWSDYMTDKSAAG